MPSRPPPPVAAPRGPVLDAERALAPDVARGTALLGIALANVVVLLWGRPTGPGHRPVGGSTADRLVDGAVALLVDNRAYPLFALLLGYGTVQLLARQAAAGTPWPQARALLLRRSAGLVAFGAAHGLLLFSGDILLTYGLLSFAVVALVRQADRRLVTLAALALVPLAVLSTADGTSSAAAATGGQLLDPSTVPLGLLDRAGVLVITVLTAPLIGVGILAPMLAGVLMARRRLLDAPAEHRALLTRLAAGGTAVSLAGGLPLAVVVARGEPTGPVAVLLAVLHGVTGVAGGIGYAALFGLLAARVRRRSRARAPGSGYTGSGSTGAGRPGPVVRALAATGRRSLSAYLAQSVVLVPLLSPWALGLGDDLGTAAASLLAAGVWLATVLLAAAMDARRHPGPAERLLRRIVYAGGQGRQGTR